MKVEIVMPQMGESIAEGTIIKWWKKPGEEVEKDEIIFEISTDKVDTEIPSPAAGIFTEIVIPEGETVDIGTVLGYLETESDKAEVKTGTPKTAPAKKEAPVTAARATVAEAAPPSKSESRSQNGNGKSQFYSPVVLKIAREEGIDLSALDKIAGSGLGGRVTKKDILANLDVLKGALSTAPAGTREPMTTPQPQMDEIDYSADGFKVVPMDNMRAMIAEHMVKSVQTSPHVTAVSEADLTSVRKYREKEGAAFKGREGFSLNYTAFITKALVLAVQDFPILNTSIDGKDIIYKKNINVGIAVAIDKGLLVPVIRNSEEKNIVGLARAINDIGSRARTKKLKPEEVQGSTISITNFGVFGNLFGTPIINQPNVAILGVGAIKKRPVVINDAIAIRDMMYLSLTFDHRLIDGEMGGRFLERVVEYLQDVDALVK